MKGSQAQSKMSYFVHQKEPELCHISNNDLRTSKKNAVYQIDTRTYWVKVADRVGIERPITHMTIWRNLHIIYLQAKKRTNEHDDSTVAELCSSAG